MSPVFYSVLLLVLTKRSKHKNRTGLCDPAGCCSSIDVVKNWSFKTETEKYHRALSNVMNEYSRTLAPKTQMQQLRSNKITLF